MQLPVLQLQELLLPGADVAVFADLRLQKIAALGSTACQRNEWMRNGCFCTAFCTLYARAALDYNAASLSEVGFFSDWNQACTSYGSANGYDGSRGLVAPKLRSALELRERAQRPSPD